MAYFRRPEQKHALRQREDIDTLIQDKLYSKDPFRRGLKYSEEKF